MKAIRFFPLFILAFLSVSVSLKAQRHGMPDYEPKLLKWTSNSQFLFRSWDKEKHPVISRHDCKTGKTEVVAGYINERQVLINSLPGGFDPGTKPVFSTDTLAMVASRENDLWYFRLGDTAVARLTSDPLPEMNARFSPDGRKISYTKNKDLYVFDLNTGRENRITNDATDRIYNGWASWIYYEEILGRDSEYAAFWWSPDSRLLAYLRFDDTPVPLFNLVSLKNSDGMHGRLESTPYPKPGDPNPKVKMGIAEIATGKTTWVKTDESIDQYIAWPSWTPDSRRLMIQVLNRDQNDLRFILADAVTGDYREIYRETRPTWVSFYEDINVLNDGTGFILRSCKSDWHNLYYYGWEGRLISQITDFNWRVTAIASVDDKKKTVYFTGTGPNGLETHLYRIGLDGSKMLRLTSGSGTHSASVSPDGSYLFDVWSRIDNPGGADLIDRNGKVLRELFRYDTVMYSTQKQSRQEVVFIKTSDSLFNMPALLTFPLNFNPSEKYPVVFTVYGGPDRGDIRDKWQGFNPSWYAKNNIVTIDVMHRGSGYFGGAGLDYMYRSLGKWEISDYSDAVKWLREQAWADPERMGITGGSYGGYVTCLALTKGADFWTHGIADFSVTDYRLYDNVYTERYMDTPGENTQGYDEASVLTYAEKLKGKLLIRHSDMDDNVHMQNSMWLATTLQDLNKPFELMIYPGERHGVRGAKRKYMAEEANRFWLREFFGR